MSNRIPKALAAAHTSLLTKGPLASTSESGSGDGGVGGVGVDGGLHYGQPHVSLQKERSIFTAHNKNNKNNNNNNSTSSGSIEDTVVDTSQAAINSNLRRINDAAVRRITSGRVGHLQHEHHHHHQQQQQQRFSRGHDNHDNHHHEQHERHHSRHSQHHHHQRQQPPSAHTQVLPGARVAAKEMLYAEYDARKHGATGRPAELSDNCYRASAKDVVDLQVMQEQINRRRAARVAAANGAAEQTQPSPSVKLPNIPSSSNTPRQSRQSSSKPTSNSGGGGARKARRSSRGGGGGGGGGAGAKSSAVASAAAVAVAAAAAAGLSRKQNTTTFAVGRWRESSIVGMGAGAAREAAGAAAAELARSPPSPSGSPRGHHTSNHHSPHGGGGGRQSSIAHHSPGGGGGGGRHSFARQGSVVEGVNNNSVAAANARLNRVQPNKEQARMHSFGLGFDVEVDAVPVKAGGDGARLTHRLTLEL